MITQITPWIIKTIYFILPGVFANMTPVLVKGIFKKLAFPVDFNKKIKGKRIFGKNKTFRGLLLGVLAAILVAYIQFMLYSNPFFKSISLHDYSQTNILLLGFLMGIGVLTADLANSFIKRRLNRKEGSQFMPWDQLNAPVGGIAFSIWLYNGGYLQLLLISTIVIAFALHLLVRTIGYYLKISNERW